jgi:hypothetical protein
VVFSVESHGSFNKTQSFLTNLGKIDITRILHSKGQEGVTALESVTPQETGLAAGSWYYEVSSSSNSFQIAWYNSDVENGFPVVIMLQYGYGTGTGGYVQGRDFINPAIQPIFDQISEDVWKAVTSA